MMPAHPLRLEGRKTEDGYAFTIPAGVLLRGTPPMSATVTFRMVDGEPAAFLMPKPTTTETEG